MSEDNKCSKHRPSKLGLNFHSGRFCRRQSLKNMKVYLFSVLYLLASLSFGQVPDGFDRNNIPKMSKRNGYMEPFKIFDNVYYVGDKWVSSYLVVTKSGLVLIDTLEAPFSKWIPINIRSLGLNPKDIKYIFVTHGHSDHVGGVDYLQSKFGAIVAMSEEGLVLAKKQITTVKPMLSFTPPAVNIFVSDGDVIEVGDTEFTFHYTPGHTNGAMSIEFNAKDFDAEYRALVYGGMGVNFSGIPSSKAYINSVKKVKELNVSSNPFEVNLASHPHLANIFERRDLIKTANAKNSYVDRSGFEEFLKILTERGRLKLEKELSKMAK